MSVANVDSMEFESEQALQEFAEKYKAFGHFDHSYAVKYITKIALELLN